MGEQPNIVWVTVDSVRADHTSVGEYRRDTTPNLRRIADDERGVAFSDCIAHAIWSLPSAASILTGTYPTYHGTGLWNEVLPERIPTVPELLSDVGYRTAGLSQNAYFNHSTLLDRGFDRFEWLNKKNVLLKSGIKPVVEFLLNIGEHGGGYTAPLQEHRPEFFARKVLERWLSSFEAEDEPFFVYAHTLGAHLPYSPPLSYRDRYTDDIAMSTADAARVAFDRSQNHYQQTARNCDYPSEEREAIVAMYDGLIRYVDQQIGELFEFVRSLDLGETVFVVTADHGELLGERGVLGHQLSLHDGLITVPAVVHGSPSLAEFGSGICQHVDIVKSVLNEAGCDTEELHGIDIRNSERQYALAQRGERTYRTAVERMKDESSSFDEERFYSGVVDCVRGDEFKFVTNGAEGELYRLPDETVDVSEEYPDAREAYENELQRFQDEIGAGKRTDRTQELSEDLKEQLSDLGYADG